MKGDLDMKKINKRFAAFVAFVLVAGAIVVPVAVNAMNNNAEEVVTNEADLDELRDELQEMEQKEIVTDVQEDEYKSLSDEVSEMELEYEEFDYQEEVELRMDTLEASLSDIRKEIDGVNDHELKKELEYRYNKLIKVYDKYTEILSSKDQKNDYEEIAYNLNRDLEKVYEKIN